MGVDDGAGDLLELRQATWRDAWQVGLVGAWTMHGEARGKRLPDGRRRRRLHRARAMHLPGVLGLYCLLLQNVMSVGVLPSWVGRTIDDEAAVGAWSLDPRDQLPRYRQDLGRMVRLTWPAYVVMTVVLAIWPPLQWWINGGVVVAFLPLLWPAAMELRERRATRVLREVQEEVLAAATGPVYWAAGLVSGNHGAGAALLHALIAEADAQGITLVGRTEAGPLVRMYQGGWVRRGSEGTHVVGRGGPFGAASLGTRDGGGRGASAELAGDASPAPVTVASPAPVAAMGVAVTAELPAFFDRPTPLSRLPLWVRKRRSGGAPGCTNACSAGRVGTPLGRRGPLKGRPWAAAFSRNREPSRM